MRTAFSSCRLFRALETFYIAATLADFFLISALTCIRINGETGRRENGLYIKPTLSTLTLCAHSLCSLPALTFHAYSLRLLSMLTFCAHSLRLLPRSIISPCILRVPPPRAFPSPDGHSVKAYTLARRGCGVLVHSFWGRSLRGALRVRS